MDYKKSNTPYKLNMPNKSKTYFISFLTFIILINQSISELIVKSPSNLVEEFKSKK
jgi:hypothetical protein